MKQELTSNSINNIIKRSLNRVTAWTALLLMLIMFLSALGVVYVKYSYRNNFIALQAAKAKQIKLIATSKQLLLEETTWSNYGRIENIATKQMDMVTPTAKATKILVMPGNATLVKQQNPSYEL